MTLTRQRSWKLHPPLKSHPSFASVRQHVHLACPRPLPRKQTGRQTLTAACLKVKCVSLDSVWLFLLRPLPMLLRPVRAPDTVASCSAYERE